MELDESITLSFLHVLDRLEPVERAVFLLHDVFGASHDEMAELVGGRPRTADRSPNGLVRRIEMITAPEKLDAVLAALRR